MTLPEKTTASPQTGWDASSTCRALEEAGVAAGREYGQAEAMSRTLARLLKRQAKQRFGDGDGAGQATLDGLAQSFANRQLEELAPRLLTASGWADWLTGVVVPPPAPGMPEYAKKLAIDFEPPSPSIDTYMKATMMDGSKAVIHLRLQKVYQPDLDRVLFESSCKLERKYGSMPIVGVFLMWPATDGPAIKGRYEDRDRHGRLKRVFTYKLRRAWEIEPDEAMQGLGTMILAPLTRGAKQRMPEIVQMLKDGLDRFQPDDLTRQLVWETVYWSMGVVCDVEEAHRVLGDVLPLIQTSPNYLSAKGQAFAHGFAEAQREGPLAAARSLILQQATCRFGEQDGAADALAAVTAMEDLEALARRVLTAVDWQTLLAKPS
jgi:hypothetical protein